MMNERLVARLEFSIDRLTEAINNSQARNKASKPQESMKEVVGEFTSRPVEEVPKARAKLDEARIREALKSLNTPRPAYDRLVETVVIQLCQDAADGNLTVVIPEVV